MSEPTAIGCRKALTLTGGILQYEIPFDQIIVDTLVDCSGVPKPNVFIYVPYLDEYEIEVYKEGGAIVAHNSRTGFTEWPSALRKAVDRLGEELGIVFTGSGVTCIYPGHPEVWRYKPLSKHPFCNRWKGKVPEMTLAAMKWEWEHLEPERK